MIRIILICFASALLLFNCATDENNPAAPDDDPPAAPKTLLPGDSEIDSCALIDTIEEFNDTSSLYDKVDGYAEFFLDRGWVRCAYARYSYPNALLINTPEVGVTVNEMEHADSAQALYLASIDGSDTASVITLADGEAVVLEGFYNYNCFMVRDCYMVEFDGIYYDTTTGATDAIICKFNQFCQYISNKIE